MLVGHAMFVAEPLITVRICGVGVSGALLGFWGYEFLYCLFSFGWIITLYLHVCVCVPVVSGSMAAQVRWYILAS